MSEILTLKKRSDFLKVGDNGRKSSTKTFVLLTAPGIDDNIRVGYTVSKKTSKLAVQRNRIRRRLKAAVHEIFEKHALPGQDYVIIGRRECLERDYKDLKSDLKYALKKLVAGAEV